MEWYMHHVNPHLSPLWDSNENDQSRQEKESKRLGIPIHIRKEKADDNSIADVQNASGGNEPQKNPDSVAAIPKKRKPSKPLCDECLQIVQRAPPVNLDYVNVSGGHLEHPHMGARVEFTNGTSAYYVHDETRLRRNPPPFGMNHEDLVLACQKRDNNFRMLREKVVVDFQGDEQATQTLGKDHRVKLFCLVYTTEKGHGKIHHIQETWGQKCDGFMVGSTKTDPLLDTAEILHEGPEEYDNIWQKVRSMWAYIYDNYYQTYDWFHIVGDDAFLLVENLKLYLESEEIRTAANGGVYLPDGTETEQTPMFLGRRFALNGNRDFIFISGGSGYTINKAALKVLVVQGLDNFLPYAKTFSEDTVITALFRNIGKIYPYETKDENGGERYMPFMPGSHYSYHMPADISQDWYAKYSIDIKMGLDHCAAKSVAFHYVQDVAIPSVCSSIWQMSRRNALLGTTCLPVQSSFLVHGTRMHD